MHMQNYDHTDTQKGRAAPVTEGMGGRAALWIATAIGLVLILNAVSSRVMGPVAMLAVSQSD